MYICCPNQNSSKNTEITNVDRSIKIFKNRYAFGIHAWISLRHWIYSYKNLHECACIYLYIAGAEVGAIVEVVDLCQERKIWLQKKILMPCIAVRIQSILYWCPRRHILKAMFSGEICKHSKAWNLTCPAPRRKASTFCMEHTVVDKLIFIFHFLLVPLETLVSIYHRKVGKI